MRCLRRGATELLAVSFLLLTAPNAFAQEALDFMLRRRPVPTGYLASNRILLWVARRRPPHARLAHDVTRRQSGYRSLPRTLS